MSNLHSQVRSGVPQGTKLGPWLYILMINDLTTIRTKPWKFVDDTTLSEVVHKGKPSSIQKPVDEVQEWTRSNLADRGVNPGGGMGGGGDTSPQFLDWRGRISNCPPHFLYVQ